MRIVKLMNWNMNKTLETIGVVALAIIGIVIIFQVVAALFPTLQTSLDAWNVSVSLGNGSYIDLNILKILVPLIVVFGVFAYAFNLFGIRKGK